MKVEELEKEQCVDKVVFDGRNSLYVSHVQRTSENELNELWAFGSMILDTMKVLILFSKRVKWVHVQRDGFLSY